GLFAAALVGCQTYNFEPVRPLAIAQTTQTTTIGANAHKLEPNLMLVLDKSGSMTKPIDPNNPACPAQCGLVNGSGNFPAGCPTRISDLQDAMNDFLTNDGSLFRIGLDELPDPNQSNNDACAAAPIQDLQVNLPNPSPSDDPSANQTQANSINQIIQRIVP